jgi:ferredoxin
MVVVELPKCVRCAACATAAPTLFDVTKKGVRVVRQPETDCERSAARAAQLICPTQAISECPTQAISE